MHACIKHGERLNTREIRRSIIDLRYKDKKSQREIGQIVGLSEARISQILEEHRSVRSLVEFDNLSPKVAKVDLRRKLDPHRRSLLIGDIKKGKLSGKEIAKRYEISETRVSEIKKAHESLKSNPVYIRTSYSRAQKMFGTVFINGLLKTAMLEFKEDAVGIKNSRDGKPPYVFAVFSKQYFEEYKIEEPCEGYIESDVWTDLKLTKARDIEIALLNPNKWKLRYIRVDGTKKKDREYEYDDIDWRDFTPRFLKMDYDGIPTSLQTKAQVFSHVFPTNQRGEMKLKMEDGELTCSFPCSYDFDARQRKWNCKQSLRIEKLEKNANAVAVVNLETLNAVLKLLSGPVWIGMSNSHTGLAIGQGSKEVIVCFLLTPSS